MTYTIHIIPASNGYYVVIMWWGTGASTTDKP